jgi:hypothetical protein
MSFAATVQPTEPAATVAPASPPALAEVQQALLRVFGEDVTLASDGSATSLAGDLNGDHSIDLAVLVKPNPRKLSDLNSEFANWSIQNPHHAFILPRHQHVIRPPLPPAPDAVRSGETLVAIIHGVGALGWRDPGSRQAFLLEHVAGSRMRVETAPAVLRRDIGTLPASANVLAESLAEENGVLYWNGAGYAWHREP